MLKSNKIGSEGAKQLAANQTWKSLKIKKLKSNKIGSDRAEHLARNKSWI